MRSIVIHFSQTGNTRKIGRAIQSGIRQAAGHCDIAPIKGFEPRDLADYDLVGVGCPVYDWNAPGPVKEFLDRFRGLEEKQLFLFATHGPYRGGVFTDLAEHAHNRVTVIAYRSWYGEATLQHIPKPYFTDGHPDDIDGAEAKQWGAQVAELGRQVASGQVARSEVDKCPELLWRKRVEPGYRQIAGAQEVRMTLHDIQLTYDRNKCTYPKCHICIDNCPVDCINLDTEPGVIQGPGCLYCHFCEKICPTGAIDADWSRMAQWWRGFITTNVRLSIDTATRKGYFRWLIPQDTPVEEGTPFYIKYSRRPRIKIGRIQSASPNYRP